MRQAALFQVLLMILLGGPERGRGLDLRDDRPRKMALRSVARGFRLSLLLGRMLENRGPVLAAIIRSLPSQRGGVAIGPELFQQIVIADDVWIEGHFHVLGVPGAVRAHLLICRMVELAADIAHLRGLHSGQTPESRLDAPKTAGTEGGLGQRRFFHILIVPSRLETRTARLKS